MVSAAAMPRSVNPILLDLPTQFETERLLLRVLGPGDGQAMYDAVLESAERQYPWLTVRAQMTTPEQAETLARRAWARYQERQAFRMGVWRRADGRFVGTCALHSGDWSVPRFEIGYWVRASLEGNGYATEAGRGMIAFAFEALGVVRLEARFDARNTRSQRVVERLGFTFEARLRHYLRALDGALADEMVYAKIVHG